MSFLSNFDCGVSFLSNFDCLWSVFLPMLICLEADTHRVDVEHDSMQAEGLQHAADGKLRQGCAACAAAGVVSLRAADAHGQT